MAHLYLHIGMNKTGSTSIQKVLKNNKDILLSSNIDFYRKNTNHTFLIFHLFKKERLKIRQVRAKGITTLSDMDDFYRDDIRSFETFLKEGNNNDIVISGESINRLEIEAISDLKEYMLQFFDGITVLIYLRPPKSAFVSMAQQRVKGGLTIPDVFEVFGRVPVLPYRNVVEPWIDQFGRENVQVGIFEKSALLEGDVVHDFLDKLGIQSEIRAQVNVRHLNASLSLPAVKLLSALNAGYQDRGHEYGLKAKFFSELKGIEGPRFGLPHEFLESQVEMHRDHIRWVKDNLGLDLVAHDIDCDNVNIEQLESFKLEETVEILRVLGPEWLFEI